MNTIVQDFVRNLSTTEKDVLIALLRDNNERTACKKGKPCGGCPFNDGITEEATNAQNVACLPSAQDILQILNETNKHWACHGHRDLTCGGLIKHFADQGITVDTTIELHTEPGVHTPLGIPK